MLDRLCGLETEYAVRFTPRTGDRLPSNRLVYEAIVRALAATGVRARGRRRPKKGDVPEAVFLSNGGKLSYEALALAPEGGLVEAGTPECRGPAQLVLYQRAQDEMLRRALPEATRILSTSGFAGELDLIKNCRDAKGHLYGAQENYDVELADGAALWLWRAGMLAALPLHLTVALLWWALFVLLFPILFVAAIVTAIGIVMDEQRGVPNASTERRWRPGWGRLLHHLELAILAVSLAPFTLLMRLVLRRLRKTTTSFFASRCILTGAGTLEPDASYVLSEKAPGIGCVLRTSGVPEARGIFELADVLKAPGSLMLFRPRAWARALSRRQRLTIGASDSNMAQVAEYLKVGTALVVLDMSEQGWLDDAPVLADPIAALHAIVRDPTLRARVLLRDGTEGTAMELQRWYLAKARAFVSESAIVSMEARQLVTLWERTLDALERDPGTLVGRLDWPTKRFLIEKCAGEEPAARKKIELRYHEIGSGWYRELAAEGVTASVVTDDEIERAIAEPPADTPALARGRLVAELAESDATVDIDWDRVRIGGAISGKLIDLASYRRR